MSEFLLAEWRRDVAVGATRQGFIEWETEWYKRDDARRKARAKLRAEPCSHRNSRGQWMTFGFTESHITCAICGRNVTKELPKASEGVRRHSSNLAAILLPMR